MPADPTVGLGSCSKSTLRRGSPGPEFPISSALLLMLLAGPRYVHRSIGFSAALKVNARRCRSTPWWYCPITLKTIIILRAARNIAIPEPPRTVERTL